MLNTDMSCGMKCDVEKILGKVKNDTTAFNISMTFTSDIMPDLRVQLCREIDTITIEQDFVKNYADKIHIHLTLNRDEYVTLYYLRKNLTCKWNFCKYHPDRSEPTLTCAERKKMEEKTMTFKAVVTRYEDIFKGMDVDRIWPDYHDKRKETDADRTTYEMEMDLIDKKIYDARKLMINDLYRNVTILDVLKHTINRFGFKLAKIVKPDNEATYTNLLIPPAYGVDSIMSFFQTAAGLGVYNDGFCSYITHWWKKLEDPVAWYVWSRYGKPICNENPIHVYHPGADMYSGHKCNHYVCGCTGVNILGSGDLHMINYSDLGSENEQLGANIQLSDAVLDGTRYLKADNDAKVMQEIYNHVQIPTDPVDKKDVVLVKPMPSNGNLFKIISELRNFQGSTATFTWNFAYPWTFTPATEVKLHYDHALGYKVIKGVCEKAIYNIVRDSNQPANPIFICTGYITLAYDNVQKPGKSHV